MNQSLSKSLRWIPALIAIGGIGLAELHFAPLMAGIRAGESAQFWHAACGVSIDGNDERNWWMDDIYPGRDGWLIYRDAGYHDETVYRVREGDAVADFPAVVIRLRELFEGADACEIPVWYELWRQAPAGQQDAASLLDCVWSQRLARMGEWSCDPPPGQQVMQFFNERWSRHQRYWQTQLFEFCYLSAVLLVVAWPWLRAGRAWRWALHLGVAPILLFLPYFLGYATFTFTSRGPSGGVFYPWLISPFRWLHGVGGDWDWKALASLPKWLEPLSQVVGPSMVLTGMGYVGPITTIAASGGIAGAILILGWAARRFNNAIQRKSLPKDNNGALGPLEVGPIRTEGRVH